MQPRKLAGVEGANGIKNLESDVGESGVIRLGSQQPLVCPNEHHSLPQQG